jgi:drug/metabolite transporter (DMT)-like permease
MDSLLQRALEWAITIVVVALLLRWGWDILRPELPYLAGGVAMVVLGGLVIRYRRDRYW